MENQIPQVISQTIDVLSQKFGATGVHLWEVLLRQQLINAIECSVYFIVSIVLLPFVIISLRKTKSNNDFPWQIFVISFLITISIISFSMGLTAVFNPEYGAIKSIISPLTSCK